MNKEKHKDWKSRRIAASLKLHKLDGSWSLKHQEVALAAEYRWEKISFKEC